MNRVEEIGRLTRDPEIRVYVGANGDNKSVADFSIAVDRRFKDDETDFFECVAFGYTAKFLENYVRKGTKVAVSGRLRQDRWTNKDGESRSKVVIIADEVEFAGSNPNAGQPNTVTEPDYDINGIPDDVFKDLPFVDEIEVIDE